jgi:DNA-binding CsgD family transcriptional regulator
VPRLDSLERFLEDNQLTLSAVMVEIFEGSSLGILLAQVHPEKPRVWVNAAGRRILAEEPPEQLFRGLEEGFSLVGPGGHAAAAARMEQVRRGESPEGPAQYQLARPGDTPRWIEVDTQLLASFEEPVVLWVFRDITARKRVEQELGEERRRLRQSAAEKAERNRELRALIDQVARERARQRKLVEANAQLMLLPQLERLKGCAPPELHAQLDALQVSVVQLGSELGLELSRPRQALTPRELEICGLIRAGNRSVEIAAALGLSVRSVDAHRYNIRKKLGLRGTEANLASHLAFLDKRNT